MVNRLFYLSRLSLIAALIICFNAASSRADDARNDPIIRLRVTESFSPIGKLHSFGAATINGRRTEGEQMIWAGDMIEAPANSSVRVSLDSIGRITLRNSGKARLAIAYEMANHNTVRRVLIAWLVKGDLTAQLEPNSSAYVEAWGSAFSSSSGASFRLTIREGQPVVDAVSGAVWAVSTRQPEYILQRVSIDRSGRMTDLGNREIRKRKRQLEPITVRLTGKRPTRTVAFTPGPGAAQQDFEPIANELLEFQITLDNPTAVIGAMNPPQKETDQRGIASSNFEASSISGTGTLRVTAPRLGIWREWRITVHGGLSLLQRTLIGGAIAGGIIIIWDPFDDGQIMQQPPPEIP
ncbi:MAG TPA: hypothetical protein VF131_00230 [Blastocatellia bacterium]|nr:hypothetical protein [Blastocatellia bacterium]